MTRKVKIICTLGPSSYEEESIEQLIHAGMDIARLNFSHGDHEFYRVLINRIRHVAARLNKPIAIMQDLQGPKIRVGTVKNNGVVLTEGEQTIITIEKIVGDEKRFSSGYLDIISDVEAGDSILLDDGKMLLMCHKKDENNLYCTIVQGGLLKSNKGINLPHSATSAQSLTEKDVRDLHFGAQANVDCVALSFVRSADDVIRLRSELALTKTRPLVLAKLEKQQAIDNLDSILKVCDGVMVARGDLGVEIPPEQVPMIQKQVIERARAMGKFAVVATEMLESMTKQIRPTRAEASDVANAVLDGADMLMLSAETAAGDFPVAAVRMMDKIILHVEDSARAMYWQTDALVVNPEYREVQNSLCMSAVNTCQHLKAEAIAMFSNSGASARLVSAYRPQQPIMAFVPDANVQRQLAFCWGVQGHILKAPEHTSELVSSINNFMLSSGKFKVGDRVIIVTKIPLLSKEHSNTLHVHTLRPT